MNKGLTLIEMCISIAVFSLLLLSMLGIFHQGYRFLGTARERDTALNLAIGILEQHSDWLQLRNISSAPPPHDPPVNGLYPLTSVSLNDVTYDCSLTIADGPYAAVKRITAAVEWSRSGQDFEIRLSSLKGET